MGSECVAKDGVLILVAGPSGAGKDTLISAAREALESDSRFSFPKRVITRKDQTGEDHLFLDAEAFRREKNRGGFFLSWEAHGHLYGIPVEILVELKRRRTVVINVSRRVVDEARLSWPNTKIILIDIAPEILRQRLAARGRENDAEIEKRVSRAVDRTYDITGEIHKIDNSGPLSLAVDRFLGSIVSLARAP